MSADVLARAPEGTTTNFRRVAVALAAVAALIFLAGDVRSAISFALFLVGVAAPTSLLLAVVFERAGAAREDARLLGYAATLVLVAPLYILKKVLPLPPVGADALIVASAWLGVWRTRAARGVAGRAGALLAGSQAIWLCVVWPALFCASWLGYAVQAGTEVRFFGLYFVDFGNLVSVTNVVRASPGLPLSTISETGRLGYHWLYFSFPAWVSDFGGLGARPANALIMTNLLTATIFYRVLVRTFARVLEAAALPTRFAPHLGALVPLSLSTLYAYQAVITHFGRGIVTLGARNYLLLQLPHSIVCFGNNTLALTFILLGLEALRRWNAEGRWGVLCIAAALTAVLPGYSITLLFPLTAGIILWAMTGRLRRPLVVLAVFGFFGGVALGIFLGIGVLGGGGNAGLAFSFDGGHFIQNLACAFFPVTVAFILWRWRLRDRTALGEYLVPNLCVAAACLIVPTVMMTRGSPTAAVDFSMKTAALYLAATAPIAAVAAAWLVTVRSVHRGLAVFGVMLAAVGLMNSGAYLFQHAVYRLRGRVPADMHAVALDHARALELVARESPRLILLDEVSTNYTIGDPAVMLGGKRVLVGSVYENTFFVSSSAAIANRELWLAWQRSGHVDPDLARLVSERADLLITATPVPVTPSWTPIASFGDVFVYRSTRAATIP